jgi:diguanylate cyclase (GGDEF)-like protein
VDRPQSLLPATTAVAVLGAASVLPLWALPTSGAIALSGVLHVVAMLVAAVLLLRPFVPMDPSLRRSRRFLAASMAAATAGNVVGVGYLAVLGSVPVPSAADVVTLLWVPLAAYGLWLVPSHDGSPAPLFRLLADAAVAATSLLFTSWVLVLSPISKAHGWDALGHVTELAYPVTDVVIVTLALSLLPRARADHRDFLVVAASGLLVVAVGDSASAALAAGSGRVSFGWQDAVLQAGLLVVAFAAALHRTPVVREAPSVTWLGRAVFVAPVSAIVVGVGFALRGGRLGVVETLLGAAITAALMLRQLVYVRELRIVAEGHRAAAAHDALTELPNRKAFIALLTERLETPGAGPAAVVILDLDGFKAVNDSFGHDCGDRVLVDFAAVLREAAAGQMAARLGGDEFALLVVDDDPERAARRIAERVVRSLMPEARGLTLTCSAGITPLRPGDGPADALRRADLAMFWAKRSPGALIAVFREEMAERADRRSMLLAQLSGAVARGELHLEFQPLHRLSDGRLAGAEALLRWRHPVLGDVPPDEFVPLAEENGDIRQVGAWVVDAALEQVAAWRRRGAILPQLLVNVAAAQFTDELPTEVLAALARHGVSPHCLVVEITEGQVPGLAANRAVQQLRARGVRVAMDDFGSGYSSLAQLARLPVDVLKIDRDFIVNLDAEEGRHVLDAVVTLAHALGLQTVAEGVEEPHQAAEVAAAGVDYAQGFLFSPPLTADELFPQLTRPVVVRQRSSQQEPAATGD